MRIFILRKRVLRPVFCVLLIVLAFPLVRYYATQAVFPETVHFRQPRGDALKVSVDDGVTPENLGVMARFVYYLHEYYQNGL